MPTKFSFTRIGLGGDLEAKSNFFTLVQKGTQI